MPAELTPRNLRVLRLAAQGLDAAQTGSRLGMTEQAVDSMLRNVRRKLGASSLDEALRKAVSRGLVPARPGRVPSVRGRFDPVDPICGMRPVRRPGGVIRWEAVT